MLLTSHADAARRVSGGGLNVIEDVHLDAVGLQMLRVAVPDGSSEREVIEKLRTLDPSGVATYNHLYEPARGASAPATEVPASRRSSGKPLNAKIGLVDAGIDSNHPLLKEVHISAHAFGPEGQNNSHGTAVASRLADAAPGATIVAADVFTMTEDGQELATAESIIQGLDWLAKQKVPVINLSLTGPANPILEAMAARMCTLGYVLVAAVGNEGPRGAPQYPAAYNDVVGVTAVDAQNHVYIYANQGDYVDFAASGVDTPVANSKGSVVKVSGTSYAAPIVTAALARMIDAPDRKRAEAALTSLKSDALDAGAPGRDPVFGYGIIHSPE
ncbi:MAG: S8 family serine peptidase [Micropepsaceae bacterium]